MEWTRIDYGGTTISATDFLNGALVEIGGGVTFIPGYYVQQQQGEMDGPALWPRKKAPTEFAIRLVED